MKKRIWNQLKKAVMITAAVGILGAGAVSAAEFEVAELYVPAVGLKQSAQWPMGIFSRIFWEEEVEMRHRSVFYMQSMPLTL